MPDRMKHFLLTAVPAVPSPAGAGGGGTDGRGRHPCAQLLPRELALESGDRGPLQSVRTRAPGTASGLDLGTVLWVTGSLCDSYHRLKLFLPDSLTTWEIHGVSLSKSKGEVALSGLRLLSSLWPAPAQPSAPCGEVEPVDLAKPSLHLARERVKAEGEANSFPGPSSLWPEVMVSSPSLSLPHVLIHRPVCSHARPCSRVPGIPPAPAPTHLCPTL